MTKNIIYHMFILLLAGTNSLQSQSDASFEIKPSNARQAVSFNIEHTTANFIAEGYNGPTVVVEIFRGNKPVQLNSLPIKFEENNNIITLELLDNRKGYEFRVKVPKTSSLDIEIPWSKTIEVKNTKGDIKISTLTSDVKLSNIVGNVEIRSFSGMIDIDNLDGCPIISSTEGKISLSFKKLPVDFPSVLDTVSGEIILYLEETASVLLRLKFNVPERHFKLKSAFDLVPADSNSFPGEEMTGLAFIERLTREDLRFI